jgi:tripartite-type tricarboxylate transporter receptor subunit TctC
MGRSIVGAVLGVLAGTVAAQGYPAKTIHFIVPFPPGGGTDIVARTVAARLSEANKWVIVLENKPGAGGNLGLDQAAKSPGDGYTMVIGQTSNLAINPTLYAKLPYDPVADCSRLRRSCWSRRRKRRTSRLATRSPRRRRSRAP